MKILHVFELSIPDFEVGYTIRGKYMVENQKRHGLEPVVVTSPIVKGFRPGIWKDVIDGITYYRTNFIKSPNNETSKIISYWTRFRMLQRYRKAVLNIIKKERPSIIHAHSSYANGIAANYASKKTGIPSIYEIRGFWNETEVAEGEFRSGSLKHAIFWNLELYAIRNASRIIAISQGIKDEMVARGIDGNKIDILPNGVDTKLFVPRKKDDSLAKKHDLTNNFVIGYIGSIRRLEGLSYLIDAFKEVICQTPRARLLIVGDGAERANLEEHAKRLGLNGRIIFTGTVPHKEILNYYSLIDVFVFPRVDAKVTQTVTPLKPLEVMSAGKVCVGSNVGGLRELINDNYNGLLFECGDAHDLSNKIMQLIRDKELYRTLRTNGMEQVKKERDWNVLIPRYLDIYRRLLNQSVEKDGA
jgi:PEP-CTERM/exosortase A-associated glycosyltransferase